MMRRRWIAAAGCLALVVTSGAAWAADDPIRFGLARDFPAATVTSGLGAGAIASADFDGDGNPDLVVSNCGGGGPSVLLGDGTGGFAPPISVPSDYDACTVGAGDFTGNGIPDIVAASYFSGDVALLLGNGDGTFTESDRHYSGNTPMQLAIADFDGDGHLDIASMNNRPGTVTVLLGNGDGTVRVLAPIAMSNQAISIVAGDFDGDGIPDIAVTEAEPTQTVAVLPGEVQVRLGNGDGTFGPRTGYAVGGAPEYVGTGDLDNDGHLDLVVGNAIYNNDVSILYGIGDGRFEPEQRTAAPGMGVVRVAGAGPDGDPGIQVADYDQDGNLDIAVIQTVAGKVVILRGDGRRNFTLAGEFPAADLPESFLATDLTGDGYPDLAVPGNAPALATVLGLTTRVSVLVNVSGVS